MSATEKVLVLGASGQIGTELTLELRKLYGADNVIASDINPPAKEVKEGGPFEPLDILDAKRLGEIITKYQPKQIYHLAAILSASGEKNPKKAWDINMSGLFNVLDTAVELDVKKVYWPSSIAVFGNTTPKIDTPQHTIAEPQTVYGISKLAGEGWCQYYYQHKGLDVRSLRYPGLISYQSLPGGGTTDYAVDIYYQALQKGEYTCFLEADTRLPMMYMPDALRATIGLMETPAEKVKVRTSYNLSGFSFTPAEIAAEIQKLLPGFKVKYAPDFRQAIANSWPASIDDSEARKDWGWKPAYNLSSMTADMLHNLEIKLGLPINH